jgi:ubiquinone biosynthesis protein
MAHIDVHDLGRVSTITAVLARHGFGSLLEGAGLQSYVPEEGSEPVDSDSSSAVRLRRVLTELGPTFVKLGQVLSVRPDIVPPALIREFQKLQDEVPPVPWDEAQTVLSEELTVPIDQVFAHIDHEPVASASIAQVHLAELLDGRLVAVKIQRPGIQSTIRSDLHILHTLAHLVEGRLNLPGVYTPKAIVNEFERAILDELDFRAEARNAERFRECFVNDPKVLVPAIHRSLTSSRVLVLERVDGRPLSALEQGDPTLPDVMQILLDSTVTQVFDHGFFHADPHPGNVLVLDDGRLAFLDFGLCGSLTAQMRETLVTMLVSLVFQDAETLALTIYHSGGIDGRVDLRAFRSEIERLMQKYHGSSLKDLSTQASLVEFIQVAARFQIRLVPEYALLARAASLVDGVLRSKVPDSDPVELVRPHAKRLMTDRLGPERLGADLMKLFVQAQGGFKQLPTQINQLLLDLERGQVRFQVDPGPDAELLRDEIRYGALRICLALCAMALLVAGAVMVAAWSPAPWGVPLAGIAGLLALLTAVAMWAGLVVHSLVGGQLTLRVLRRRASQVVRFFIGDRRNR